MIYNVRMSIVELVDAESPEMAIAMLRKRVELAGLEPYVDGDDVPDAFLSEDLMLEDHRQHDTWRLISKPGFIWCRTCQVEAIDPV